MNPGGMPRLVAKGLMADRVQSMGERGLGQSVQREEKRKKRAAMKHHCAFIADGMGE